MQALELVHKHGGQDSRAEWHEESPGVVAGPQLHQADIGPGGGGRHTGGALAQLQFDREAEGTGRPEEVARPLLVQQSSQGLGGIQSPAGDSDPGEFAVHRQSVVGGHGRGVVEGGNYQGNHGESPVIA